MKVDPAALAGIRAKIERAHEHFITLGREFATYQERKPYRLVKEIHANGAEHLFRLRLDEPLPSIWSVILGEAVHDLRSALDQSVYWLGVDYSKKPIERSQFPVFTRRKKLGREWGFADVSTKHPDGIPGSGLWLLRGVGPGPRAFIERIQPYPQRNGPLPKSLLGLHEFWNQDKHRLVHLFGLVVGKSELRVSGVLPEPHFVPWLSPRVLHDGAVAIRLTFDPPNPYVEVRGESDINVAVKHPGDHRRSATVTLMDMFWDTASIAARLVEAIGRQDEPVPL